MINKDKKAIAIIAAILIILIASVIGITAVAILGKTTAEGLNYMNSQQALMVAEGGLEVYLERLQNQATSWLTPPVTPSNEALGRGRFTITTANASANQIDVTSTATIVGIGGQNVTRVVTVRATRVGGYPPSFAYLQHSDSGITYQSSTGTVTGDVSSTANSGVSYLTPPPPGLTFTGTVYNGNSSVTAPTVSYAQWKAVANTVVSGTSGTYTFAANTTYYGIYYVSKNVVFQNGAKLYGTIILDNASKTISMASTTGVIINPSLDTLNPGNTNPAIICAGVITGASSTNLNITRLIFSDKNANPSIDFRYASGFIFNGSMVSMGGIRMRDMTNMNVVYDSTITFNPPRFFSGGGSQTVSTSNWNEVY